jgi:hypothetical protein
MKRPLVQFRVKTLGPPLGQSVLVHLGQQHAALKHRTLAETALSAHFISTKNATSDLRRCSTQTEAEERRDEEKKKRGARRKKFLLNAMERLH